MDINKRYKDNLKKFVLAQPDIKNRANIDEKRNKEEYYKMIEKISGYECYKKCLNDELCQAISFIDNVHFAKDCYFYDNVTESNYVRDDYSRKNWITYFSNKRVHLQIGDNCDLDNDCNHQLGLECHQVYKTCECKSE